MSHEARASSPMTWVLFLAGPFIWFAHFMAVYLLVEAACATGEPHSELLGLPVLATVTIGATVLAVVVAVVATALAYRHWRAAATGDDWIDVSDRSSGLAFAGFLLGLVFIAAICFVGLPAAYLEPC